jgi:hypothetical protein
MSINKKEELTLKLSQIQQPDIPWSGTLDVTFDKDLVLETVDNDFERETMM